MKFVKEFEDLNSSICLIRTLNFHRLNILGNILNVLLFKNFNLTRFLQFLCGVFIVQVSLPTCVYMSHKAKAVL